MSALAGRPSFRHAGPTCDGCEASEQACANAGGCCGDCTHWDDWTDDGEELPKGYAPVVVEPEPPKYEPVPAYVPRDLDRLFAEAFPKRLSRPSPLPMRLHDLAAVVDEVCPRPVVENRLKPTGIGGQNDDGADQRANADRLLTEPPDYPGGRLMPSIAAHPYDDCQGVTA